MRIISGTARGTKLFALEGNNTRPTLDRVKESIFNIIQNQIQDSVVLDLFSGSGAIGLEAASRGAKKVIMCDNSRDALKIITKNIEKTHLNKKIELYNTDYQQCLKKIANQKLDLIYLDPPYDSDMIKQSIDTILKLKLLKDTSLIILETDDKKKILNDVKDFNLKIIDERKYGRAEIIFLKYNLL